MKESLKKNSNNNKKELKIDIQITKPAIKQNDKKDNHKKKSGAKKHRITIKSENIYRQLKSFKETKKCKNNTETIEMLIQLAQLEITVHIFNKLKEFAYRTQCDSINDAIKNLLSYYIANKGLPEIDEMAEDYFDRQDKYLIEKEEDK